MKKILHFLLTAALFLPLMSSAQETRKIDFSARVGLSIGGATPVGFPASIRKIESYKPGLMPSLEIDAHYRFKNAWGIGTGIRLEQKGMTTTALVKDYYTTFNKENNGTVQSVSGYFTGEVDTEVKNKYLTIPVYATYRLNAPFLLRAGAFVSVLMDGSFSGAARNGYIRDETPVGEREDIDEASYDFSQDVRSINAGIEIGADYEIKSKFFVSANLNYAVTPLMKKDFQSIDFNLYNIFFNVGLGFRFR